MGYIKHQALIITVFRWDELDVAPLRSQLLEIDNDPVANPEQLLVGPVSALTNGYQTYLFAPDGSKEGWHTSEVGDRARALVVEYFKTHARFVEIVEVTFGEDYGADFGARAVVLAGHGADLAEGE